MALDLSPESEEIVCADVAAEVGLTAGLSVPIVIPAKGGLKSAFGLPLRAHDEVEVILTFFMRKRPHEQDLQSVTNLLSPLASELGSVIHRERTDTTLSKAYEELRQKNAELEQFAHTVSHDLKRGASIGSERAETNCATAVLGGS